MNTCRSCKAPVRWVETQATLKKAGKRMPLDADSKGRPTQHDDGNVIFTGSTTGDGTPIVRIVNAGPGRYRSHFATCAQAKNWRQR